MTLSEAQAAIMAHKRAMGFNTTDLSLELRLMAEELAELSRAERTMAGPGEVGGEAADVIIFALSLAGLLGFDAGEVVAAKMRVNAAREYRTLPNGTHVKA
jgi:NTP pyrophosphatase (non-canonical NTP hydrolase)